MLVGDIPRLNARRYPNKVGIICEGRELTWSAVNDRANRIGSYLRNAGLQPGDRVAMFAPNTLEWPEISFGLSKAGFVLVPLNVRLAPAELEYQAQDSGAKALIFHGSVAEAATAVIAGNSDITIALEIDGAGAAPDYERAILAASAGDPTPSDLKPDDLRAFIYTSGTTGLPKAVMHTHRTMLAGCVDQVVMDRSRHDDRYIAVTPFFTSGGAFRTLSWAYQGQTMVIMPKFEVPEVLATVEKYRITSTIMVPTMLQRVVSYLEERPKVDISSLTRIGYGSAPASAPLIESALELLGCDLWQRYGQSEVGGFVTMLSPEDHRQIALGDVSRVNSCGRESMYAEIAVVDDDGKECAPGEVGEITLRSEAVSPGYWNRPEETADRFRGDTLFTNDIAYRDEDGYLFLVDRKNDLIISGAFNIYPAELERVVARHPGVESVAVFGMPHPEWGESPHVSVVVRSQWSGDQAQLEQEIKDLCRAELAGYKQPRGFTTHTDFPLSGAGKVLKSELKKVVAEDTPS